MMFIREVFVFETTVNAVWKLAFHPKYKLGSASETLVCITGILSNVTLSTRFKSTFQLTYNEPFLLVLGCFLYSYSNFNSTKVQSSRKLAAS